MLDRGRQHEPDAVVGSDEHGHLRGPPAARRVLRAVPRRVARRDGARGDRRGQGFDAGRGLEQAERQGRDARRRRRDGEAHGGRHRAEQAEPPCPITPTMFHADTLPPTCRAGPSPVRPRARHIPTHPGKAPRCPEAQPARPMGSERPVTSRGPLPYGTGDRSIDLETEDALDVRAGHMGCRLVWHRPARRQVPPVAGRRGPLKRRSPYSMPAATRVRFVRNP